MLLHCLSYTLIMHTFNSTVLKQGGGEISMRLKILQRYLWVCKIKETDSFWSIKDNYFSLV